MASTTEIYIATSNLSQSTTEQENQSISNVRTCNEEYLDDTLKPEENPEINQNKTLTGSITNDSQFAEEVVTDNEDSPSLIRKINSNDEEKQEEDRTSNYEIVDTLLVEIENRNSNNESNIENQLSTLEEEKN